MRKAFPFSVLPGIERTLQRWSVGLNDLISRLDTAESDIETLQNAAPGSGGVSDGDKGDITVSGSGATWSLDLTLNQIDAPTGTVNFNDQQASSLRVENRTSDPGTPTVGQVWLRTDL